MLPLESEPVFKSWFKTASSLAQSGEVDTLLIICGVLCFFFHVIVYKYEAKVGISTVGKLPDCSTWAASFAVQNKYKILHYLEHNRIWFVASPPRIHKCAWDKQFWPAVPDFILCAGPLWNLRPESTRWRRRLNCFWQAALDLVVQKGASRHKAGAVLVRSLKLRHAEGKNVMIIISVSPRQISTAFAISGSSSACFASTLFRVCNLLFRCHSP